MSWQTHYRITLDCKVNVHRTFFLSWLDVNKIFILKHISPFYIFDPRCEIQNIRFYNKGDVTHISLRMTHGGVHTLKFLLHAFKQYLGDDVRSVKGTLSSTCKFGKRYIGRYNKAILS